MFEQAEPIIVGAHQFTDTPAGSIQGPGFVSGYDATDDRGRRRSIVTNIRHEDRIAGERQRRILQSNARDLARNFAIARWAISKHLDYVTAFSFQCRTGDTALDAEIERWMADRTSRLRFDVANRHPLRRAVRLSEACRVIDGDVGWMKVYKPGPSGKADGKIQFIESDLIRNPPNTSNQDANWINGVFCDSAGAGSLYALHSRAQGSYTFVRNVQARNLYLHAWYETRFDQVRGISPIACALNQFRDTYEGFEYALAKLKISQLFGIKITRDGELSSYGNPSPNTDADGDGTNDSGYSVELGKGPFALDMEPGDDANFLETATPATETTNFLKLMVHVSLRALDIPFSFFDESFTNFYGSRGGLIQYLKACKTKVLDNQDALDWWTAWALGLAVLNDEIKLPAGMAFEDLNWQWVPDGVPWWDPVKEGNGQLIGIRMGQTNPYQVAIETGGDYDNNIELTAKALARAKLKGVPVSFGDPAQSSEAEMPQQVEVVNDQ